MKRRLEGSCHCGGVSFHVKADIENGRNAICNCSRCERLGFLHHHVEQADFTLLRGRELLQSYRFDSGEAEHLFCRVCGVQAFYRSRSDPDKIDVNLRCLTGVDIYALSYWLSDGRHWEQSQAARRTQESSGKRPAQYAILSQITAECRAAGSKAFFDSWH